MNGYQPKKSNELIKLPKTGSIASKPVSVLQTNFEKIKSMSFEEMAKLFKNLELCAEEQIQGFSPDCSHCQYYGLDYCPFTDSRKWLQSEVEE